MRRIFSSWTIKLRAIEAQERVSGKREIRRYLEGRGWDFKMLKIFLSTEFKKNETKGRLGPIDLIVLN